MGIKHSNFQFRGKLEFNFKFVWIGVEIRIRCSYGTIRNFLRGHRSFTQEKKELRVWSASHRLPLAHAGDPKHWAKLELRR